MTASTSRSPFETRLPRLSARWVSAYRLLWATLAFAAAAVMAASLYSGDAYPALLTLRVLKGAVVISVCAILLKRRANDAVAALLSLAFLTWTITSSFDFASANFVPMLLDRIRFLLFAFALLLFPDGSWQPAWTRQVAISSAAVFLIGVAEGIGVFPTRLFLPLAIVCVVAAVAALIVRFRTAESEAVRQQLKWVALGLSAGIGLILLARAGSALSPASPTAPPMPVVWEAMFQLGIVIVALGFLISLLRYRLFDVETAISRSAALAVLTIALVATFAGTEAAIEWIGQQYLGMGIGNISAAMAAAVAAVLLNPLHGRISDWAEQRFQRDLVLLKRDLPELLADVAAGATPRQLGDLVLPRINQAVHATRSALIGAGTKIAGAEGISVEEVRRWARNSLRETTARCDRSDELFPIRLELQCPFSGTAGWLVLGPRPDGSLYGKEDLEAVTVVLPALRRAVAWTASREGWQASLWRWRSLRRQVAELRALSAK